MKSPLEQLINFLTIEPCVICNGGDGLLCTGCFYSLFDQYDSCCYMCNKITSSNRVCKSCKPRSRLRRVWWLGLYKEPFKSIVLGFKYQRKRAGARLMGRYLADTLPYVPESTVVTHVPTAPLRVRRRGYDQAEIIAKSFARARGLPYKKLLKRIGKQELIGKRRAERIDSMKNAFSATSVKHIKNADILIIDDVLTTGASLESAASVLRRAGASHVDAAVICRKAIG